MSRQVFLITIAALFVFSAASAYPSDLPDVAKEKAEEEKHRKAAEEVIGGIDPEILVDDKWAKAKRIEKPLLFYGDPTRDNDRGSLWAWGEKGRPAALLELYQNANDRTRWVYAVCNTSGRKLRADRNRAAWWRENESASELKDLPAAPEPAADGSQRQRQLKALAQKFTAHQFWDPNNSRYELRRLERPLHTYRDEANGLLDGALYIFANGTNPEIVLFLEARATAADKTKFAWQFATGRLAHAELHLEYDGKEVFDAPRGNRISAADKPYWLGFIETER
jgi:hypothetical protein